ncbi:MAG: flagellar basal body rod protein FlgB [Calditrichaeota bacterium]|nr:flagellar basal body rod protein FlgB [Calditrichota bacterium]
MLKEKLFGATEIPLLKLGLDAYALRQRAISDNIANAETYGYNRKEVKFEDKLQKMRESGLESDKIDPTLVVDNHPSDVNDISNVDIDREMADMAKNQLQFNAAARMSFMLFEMLKTSIKGF